MHQEDIKWSFGAAPPQKDLKEATRAVLAPRMRMTPAGANAECAPAAMAVFIVVRPPGPASHSVMPYCHSSGTVRPDWPLCLFLEDAVPCAWHPQTKRLERCGLPETDAARSRSLRGQ